MAKKCDICSAYDAAYVCSTCGRSVCRTCFRTGSWKCLECDTVTEQRTFPQPLGSISAWLLFAGIAMVFLGMLVATIGSLAEGGVSFGGIFLIGPIPIILGSGPFSLWLVILGAVLTLAALAFFWTRRRKAAEVFLM